MLWQTSSEPDSEPAKKKARHDAQPNGRDRGHLLMNSGDGAGVGGAGGARGGQGTGLRSDTTAAAANVRVKIEGAGEVEEYDGSYDCLICCESVRRMHALACSRCKTR